ncbi:glycoside hydrolase family 3 N-terminal domain-containing protein [Cecembia sp.]|uniref:glycoside hydrolase family 3 protein n=1 Tax=Cecembia sp. TaxID=1898110 RepID=UPI0025C02AAA|nr:glycoside hydrolase family 3 N-terminal domain-containing protein [Cecembia sp.]
MDRKIKMDPKIALKTEALLKQMTLDEKIGQMTQVRHFDDIRMEEIQTRFIGSVIHTQGPVPGKEASEWQSKFTAMQERALATRLGIPLLFGVDAVHGQNTFEGATIFPHNIGLGATRNAELVEKVSTITAIESKATGFNWVFSPCAAVPLNEKWGRVYEAFSESPEITASLTAAAVLGYQNAAGKYGVMATAKHFIGDGATDFGIEGGNTSLSIEEVHRLLIPPYRAAIDSGVGAIMASFNTFEGIAMHAHKAMITDLLKQKLNFQGIVVSDWKAYSRFGQNEIINAGIDMVMAVDGDLYAFQEGVKKAVLNGEIVQERIDDAVRRILKQKFLLGLFENPFPDQKLIKSIGIQEHRDVARQAVRESLVLLKNNNNALPLRKDQKVVVVGEFGDNAGLQSGGWTVNWQGTSENYLGATTILKGVSMYSRCEVLYDPDGTAQIEDVDVALIVVGESPYAEFFGDIGGEMDKYQLTLTERHQNYITTYVEKGIKTVVVMISGRPLVVSNQIKQCDAFVAAWLPGSEGHGIAEVLFGKYDFKGKLPHSWPKSEKDYLGKYGPNYWDNSSSPLFPIGFGLKYHK